MAAHRSRQLPTPLGTANRGALEKALSPASGFVEGV
jgi:hypothetical protein